MPTVTFPWCFLSSFHSSNDSSLPTLLFYYFNPSRILTLSLLVVQLLLLHLSFSIPLPLAFLLFPSRPPSLSHSLLRFPFALALSPFLSSSRSPRAACLVFLSPSRRPAFPQSLRGWLHKSRGVASLDCCFIDSGAAEVGGVCAFWRTESCRLQRGGGASRGKGAEGAEEKGDQDAYKARKKINPKDERKKRKDQKKRIELKAKRRFLGSSRKFEQCCVTVGM